MPAPVSGAFSAVANSNACIPEVTPDRGCATFNVSVWGTFVGTLQPQRSFDGGALWLPFTVARAALAITAPMSESFQEPEAGVMWRLACTAYTSGTANYRISQ